ARIGRDFAQRDEEPIEVLGGHITGDGLPHRDRHVRVERMLLQTLNTHRRYPSARFGSFSSSLDRSRSMILAAPTYVFVSYRVILPIFRTISAMRSASLTSTSAAFVTEAASSRCAESESGSATDGSAVVAATTAVLSYACSPSG